MKLEVKLEIEVELSPHWEQTQFVQALGVVGALRTVRDTVSAEQLHKVINGFLERYGLVSKLKNRKGDSA